jgi:adenylate kinase
MKILLIGPPGAGKTVIANKITEIFSLPFVKVGALLRDLPKNNQYYDQINKAMNQGVLAPNEVVGKIVQEQARKFPNGYVLDGWLRQLSDKDQYNPDLDCVIFLNCPKVVCKDRILNRVVCNIDNEIHSFSENVCRLCGGELVKRSDDTEETFENRWKVFEEKTLPVLDFFRNKGILIEIDASKDILSIIDEIKSKVRSSQ